MNSQRPLLSAVSMLACVICVCIQLTCTYLLAGSGVCTAANVVPSHSGQISSGLHLQWKWSGTTREILTGQDHVGQVSSPNAHFVASSPLDCCRRCVVPLSVSSPFPLAPRFCCVCCSGYWEKVLLEKSLQAHWSSLTSQNPALWLSRSAARLPALHYTSEHCLCVYTCALWISH